MQDQNRDYQILPFPPAREIVIDSGRWGTRRHVSHGLLELDVTRAREIIREHKAQTGETLSFTGWIVACFAHAIGANPTVQAYRDWRNRLIVFDDVDVVTTIETEADHVALPHVIRAANHKTFREINDEIRAVQKRPASSAQKGGIIDLAPRLPAFVRDLFYWTMLRNPPSWKKFGGTAIVTSVGMFGRGGGWGVSFLPFHTLGLLVGGISTKPGVANGEIAIREYLCLTVSIDHDIVDGAPAARLGRQLSELIEGAYGLCP